MKEPEVYQQPAAGGAEDWLPPTAALAQFEPSGPVQTAATEEEERVRYGFRVGALGLLIPLETGSEVLEMPAVTPLPGAPSGFLGLINLRGNLVPLYELRGPLHMEPRRTGRNPLALVFDQGERAVGVVIEEFPVALPMLQPLAGLPQLPDALQDHVRGGYVRDEMVWLEFDHGAFFDEMSRGIRLQTV